MKQSNVVKKSVSFPPELVEKVKKYSEERKRSFSAQVSLWVEEKLKEAETRDRTEQT